MRTLIFILQKEFTQVFRNKTMLPIIFILPIVQMVVLVYAATLEMKGINIYIVDKDLSTTSRGITARFKASPFFNISGQSFAFSEGVDALKSDDADLVLHFTENFEQRLIRDDKATIQVIANAINGTVAGISASYINQIIAGYNRDLVMEWMRIPDISGLQKQISVQARYWYNPYLNYKVFMVPGILVILVTVIGAFLVSINLVREKEMGTIEQINVTPIRRREFLLGKLIPFWIIAMFELAFGLSVGKLLFDVPIVGSLWTLFVAAGVFLLAIQAFGLLISTMANTQQQVMFISYFFMLVFIMMSGLFTPVESMPDWAQWVNKANPLSYFMRVIRMILLKGSSLGDIASELTSLGIIAVILLSAAVFRYRKIA